MACGFASSCASCARVSLALLDQALPGPRHCRCDARARRPAARAGKCWDCASNSSRLASRMSRQTLGSLAAMRVKSRKPGPASDRKSLPCGWPVMRIHQGEGQQVRQVADRGKGGVVGSRATSCSTWQPMAVQTSIACWQLRGAGALDRRQDDLACRCRDPASALLHAGDLLARNRMGGHEASRSARAGRGALRRPHRAWWSRRP